MKTKDIKTLIFPLAIIVGGFIFGKKLLEMFQLSNTKEERKTTTDATKLQYANYWSATFLDPKKYLMVLPESSANALAKKIYDAIGFFTDNESTIMGVFNSLRYQSQVASLSKYYKKLYNQDLYYTLKQNLTEGELQNILIILDKLPSGVSTNKPK